MKKMNDIIVTMICGFILLGLLFPTTSSAREDSLNVLSEEQLLWFKQAAVEHVHNQLAYENEMTDFSQHAVEAMDVSLAELDGNAPQEVVVCVSYYVGEGVVEYYLVIYSTYARNAPMFITSTPALGSYLGFGGFHITDLDNDRRHEILLIGGTEGLVARDIKIFILQNGCLENLVMGVGCGVEYLRFDVDGDGKTEMLALSRDVEDHRMVSQKILKQTSEGYSCQELPVTGGQDRLLVNAFEDIVQSGKPPSEYTIELLLAGIHQDGMVPEFIDILQPLLETYYTQGTWDKQDAICAMGWATNTTALSFLTTLLTVQNPSEARSEAAEVLLLIKDHDPTELYWQVLQQQLALSEHEIDYAFVTALLKGMLSRHDARGLRRIEALAKDSNKTLELRRLLVYRVLGDEAILPQTQHLLFDFALNAPEEEIRRLAASRLAFNHEHLTFEELTQGLRHTDANVRAEFATALGRYNDQRAVPFLLDALKQENKRRTRREQDSELWRARRNIIGALGHLHAVEAVELYRTLIFHEPDNEIAELMFHQMHAAEYQFTKDGILAGLVTITSATPLREFIAIAGESGDVEFLPHIVALAKSGQGHFVQETAAKTLGDFDHPTSRQVLHELLENASNWRVRSWAAESVGRLKGTKAEELLSTVIREDPHELVRCNAVRALGTVSTEQARNILMTQFLSEASSYVGTCYITAFASLHSPEIPMFLAEQLERLEAQVSDDTEYQDYSLLLEVANALYQLHNPHGEQALVRWLGSRYPEKLRTTVMRRLVKFNLQNKKELLHPYLNDESCQIRRVVRETLGRLKEQ